MINKDEIEKMLQNKPAIIAVCFEANYWNIEINRWESKRFLGNNLDTWDVFNECVKFLNALKPNIEDDGPYFWCDENYLKVTIWFDDSSWVSTEYISDEYDGEFLLIYHKCPEIPIV